MSKKLTKTNKILRTILITLFLGLVGAIVEEVEFLYFITILLWLYLLFRIWIKPKKKKSSKLEVQNLLKAEEENNKNNTQEDEQEIINVEDYSAIYDFSCIDFETANDNMNSACSIGIVSVLDNQIVNEYYSLIKPKDLSVNNTNYLIHGISEAMLKNEKQLNDIWNGISDVIKKSKYIVAHNAQFDMSVLYESTKQYNININNFKFLDSIGICKHYSNGKSNKLNDVAEYFGIMQENNHNALDDAKTAALCVIKSLEVAKFTSLDDYLRRIPMIDVKEFKNLKSNSSFQNRKFRSIKISDLETTETEFDENHCFFGKTVVITGDFEEFSRREIMQIVLDAGGVVRSAVSRKTDILIVGKQDKSIVGDDGLSSKQEKAITLIDQGYNIEIIGIEELNTAIDKMTKNHDCKENRSIK